MEILSKVPVINEQLTIREIGEEIVILAEETGDIHSLEGTAGFLWGCIDGNKTITEIINNLCDEYDITYDIAQSDAIDFFNDCIDKNLVSLKEK